jgi:peroxiredoxin family protein
MATKAFVLFSGTADKLQAAATMISGTAAMGVESHVFLTFWGLMAFQADTIEQPKPISPEYGEMGEKMGALMAEKGVPPWYQIMRDAKEIGDVHIHACSLTLDMLGMPIEALDPMVDDVIGVASFTGMTEDADTMFI